MREHLQMFFTTEDTSGGLSPADLQLFMCSQEEEFNWLLKEEVHAVLKQLQDVLKVKLHCAPHCSSSIRTRAATND